MLRSKPNGQLIRTRPVPQLQREGGKSRNLINPPLPRESIWWVAGPLILCDLISFLIWGYSTPKSKALEELAQACPLNCPSEDRDWGYFRQIPLQQASIKQQSVRILWCWVWFFFFFLSQMIFTQWSPIR